MEYAILEGNDIGVTIYFVDVGIDTGNILFVKKLNYEDLSYYEIKNRILAARVKKP